jgi:GNAT superfamily N-acetyltransferase
VFVSELVVRLADGGDVEEIATVHAAAWRAAFTFLPSRLLDAMTASAVLSNWKEQVADATTSMFVAVEDGSVLGFLQLRADGDEGEVMSLYVDPSAWSRGVGSRLLEFGEAWLAAEGASIAHLWTAGESRQSRGFYEHRRWVASGEEQTQTLPSDIALHEVEYRKSVK